MAKRWIVRLALAATLWAALGGLASAPAAAAEICGALHMGADPTMGITMATHTAPLGNDGMVRAVTNTLTVCP